MKQIERLRKRLSKRRASIRAVTERADAESRDLSTDEMATITALADKVEALENRIAACEAGQEDETEDEDTTEGERSFRSESDRRLAAGRSTRRSRPIDTDIYGRRGEEKSDRAPAIHVDKSGRSYSVLKAMSDVAAYGRPQGLEGELSDELQRRTTRKVPSNLWIPLGIDSEIRAAMYPRTWRRDGSRRDLTTSTGAGGIYTVPEMPMIDLLRSKLVLKRAGARFLTDLVGNIALPRQSGTGTVNWIGEGSSATPSAPALDNVPLTPHTAIALENISYAFQQQTSVDAEQLVKDDLTAIMARGIDGAGLNGTGGAMPTGLFQMTAVQTRSAGLALGTNGANPTYPNMVSMFSLVNSANADAGSLGYVTNPSLQGYLMTAPKVAASTVPMFIWDIPTREGADGQIGSFPAYTSTLVPNNLTKGSGTALSAVAFGNWGDMLIGVWDDAVGFLINPFTGQAAGQVTISMNMAVDVNIRHPESFDIVTDAKTV